MKHQNWTKLLKHMLDIYHSEKAENPSKFFPPFLEWAEAELDEAGDVIRQLVDVGVKL